MDQLNEMLRMIADDKNISPAMRACFRPVTRTACPLCNGPTPYGAKVIACTNCSGRGYVVSEA